MLPPTSTNRFTNRIADYVRYRPSYPAEAIETLQREFELAPTDLVADVGSGTGISTELLLQTGCRVFAVEPNDAMRSAAEERLRDNPNFHSVGGSAERTTLPPHSVDWVIAAQAFHWFDVDACRAEFTRILHTPPRVALLWNNRQTNTPFLAAYEDLLRTYAIDYECVRHEQVDSDGRLERFFAPGWQLRTFPNVQHLDYDGLAGRLRSSSYMPGPDHPRFTDMLAALRSTFDEHAENDTVELVYETRLYVGHVAAVTPPHTPA